MRERRGAADIVVSDGILAFSAHVRMLQDSQPNPVPQAEPNVLRLIGEVCQYLDQALGVLVVQSSNGGWVAGPSPSWERGLAKYQMAIGRLGPSKQHRDAEPRRPSAPSGRCCRTPGAAAGRMRETCGGRWRPGFGSKWLRSREAIHCASVSLNSPFTPGAPLHTHELKAVSSS